MSDQKKPTPKHPAYPPPLIESASAERDARDVARAKQIFDALGLSPVITETPDSYKIKTPDAAQIQQLLHMKLPGISMGCTQLDNDTVRVDVDTAELERRLLLYGDAFAPVPPAPTTITPAHVREAMALVSASTKIGDEVAASSKNTFTPASGTSVTIHSASGSWVGKLESISAELNSKRPVAEIQKLAERTYTIPSKRTYDLSFSKVEWNGGHPSQWAAAESEGQSAHDALVEAMRTVSDLRAKGTIVTPKPNPMSWEHYSKLKSVDVQPEHGSFVREYMGIDLSKPASGGALETALRKNLQNKIERQTHERLADLFLLSGPDYVGHTFQTPPEEMYKMASGPTRAEEQQIEMRRSQARSLIAHFVPRHAYVEVAQIGPRITVTNHRDFAEVSTLFDLVRKVVMCQVNTYGTFVEYARNQDDTVVLNELTNRALEIVVADCIHHTAQYVANTPDVFDAANTYGLKWAMYCAAKDSPLGVIPGVYQPSPLIYPSVIVTSQAPIEDGDMPQVVIQSAHSSYHVVDLTFLNKLRPAPLMTRRP